MLACLLASLAKCMAMTLGSKEHCLGERMRLKIHERLTKNVSLHIRLKLHERLIIRELGKMHGNDTGQ